MVDIFFGNMGSYLLVIFITAVCSRFSKAEIDPDLEKCKETIITKCPCGEDKEIVDVYVDGCSILLNDTFLCQPCPGSCKKFEHCETCDKRYCQVCPPGRSGKFCEFSDSVEFLQGTSSNDSFMSPNVPVTDGSFNLTETRLSCQENGTCSTIEETTNKPLNKTDSSGTSSSSEEVKTAKNSGNRSRETNGKSDSFSDETSWMFDSESLSSEMAGKTTNDITSSKNKGNFSSISSESNSWEDKGVIKFEMFEVPKRSGGNFELFNGVLSSGPFKKVDKTPELDEDTKTDHPTTEDVYPETSVTNKSSKDEPPVDETKPLDVKSNDISISEPHSDIKPESQDFVRRFIFSSNSSDYDTKLHDMDFRKNIPPIFFFVKDLINSEENIAEKNTDVFEGSESQTTELLPSSEDNNLHSSKSPDSKEDGTHFTLTPEEYKSFIKNHPIKNYETITSRPLLKSFSYTSVASPAEGYKLETNKVHSRHSWVSPTLPMHDLNPDYQHYSNNENFFQFPSHFYSQNYNAFWNTLREMFGPFFGSNPFSASSPISNFLRMVMLSNYPEQPVPSKKLHRKRDNDMLKSLFNPVDSFYDYDQWQNNSFEDFPKENKPSIKTPISNLLMKTFNKQLPSSSQENLKSSKSENIFPGTISRVNMIFFLPQMFQDNLNSKQNGSGAGYDSIPEVLDNPLSSLFRLLKPPIPTSSSDEKPQEIAEEVTSEPSESQTLPDDSFSSLFRLLEPPIPISSSDQKPQEISGEAIYEPSESHTLHDDSFSSLFRLLEPPIPISSSNQKPQEIIEEDKGEESKSQTVKSEESKSPTFISEESKSQTFKSEEAILPSNAGGNPTVIQRTRISVRLTYPNETLPGAFKMMEKEIPSLLSSLFGRVSNFRNDFKDSEADSSENTSKKNQTEDTHYLIEPSVLKSSNDSEQNRNSFASREKSTVRPDRMHVRVMGKRGNESVVAFENWLEPKAYNRNNDIFDLFEDESPLRDDVKDASDMDIDQMKPDHIRWFSLRPRHLFRVRRDSTRKWCQIKQKVRHGDLDCTIYSHKKECELTCHSGFSLPEGSTFKCQRKENKWEPDFTECKEEDDTGTEGPDDGGGFPGFGDEDDDDSGGGRSTDPTKDDYSGDVYGETEEEDYEGVKKKSLKHKGQGLRKTVPKHRVVTKKDFRNHKRHGGSALIHSNKHHEDIFDSSKSQEKPKELNLRKHRKNLLDLQFRDKRNHLNKSKNLNIVDDVKSAEHIETKHAEEK